MPQVVIVDDQKVNQLVFSRMAESIGEDVDVRAFGDPQTALDWLSEHTPDLIVTDYNMPGLDGAEFTRRLRCRAALAEVPVIVITVFEERSLRLRALNAGATDFLQSPIDQREFVTRARNLLKMRKQQQLLEARAHNLERKLEDSERSLKRAVRDSSERLAQVIDTVPAMISATDEEGRFLFMNAYYAELIDADPKTVVGQTVTAILGEDQGARSLALDRMVLENGQALPSFEEDIVDRFGMRRVFLTTKSPLNDGAERTIGVVTSSIDITDVKLAEKNLFRMANHDPLTGLPDRSILVSAAKHEMARLHQTEGRLALYFIDLDHFRQVNQSVGHGAGDRVLRAIAMRLRRISQEGDTVARLASDEFAILQVGTDAQRAVSFAAQIVNALAEPHTVSGNCVLAPGSVGVTLLSADAGSIDDLIEQARHAASAALAGGGRSYQLFSPENAVSSDSTGSEPRIGARLESLRPVIELNPFQSSPRTVAVG